MINNLIIGLLFYSLILLSFLLITNPMRVNKKANIWFGLFTLLWSSFWLDEIILLAGGPVFETQQFSILAFIQFLTPLFFYFSVRSYTNPNYTLNKKSLVYFIVPSIYFVIHVLDRNTNTDYNPVLLGLTLSHSIFFLWFCLYPTKKTYKRH